MSSLSLSFLLLSLSNLKEEEEVVEAEEERGEGEILKKAFAINKLLFKQQKLETISKTTPTPTTTTTTSQKVSNLQLVTYIFRLLILFVSGVSIIHLFNCNTTSTSNQICKAALLLFIDCILFVLVLVDLSQLELEVKEEVKEEEEEKLIQIKFKFNFYPSLTNAINNIVDASIIHTATISDNILECSMNDKFINKINNNNNNNNNNNSCKNSLDTKRKKSIEKKYSIFLTKSKFIKFLFSFLIIQRLTRFLLFDYVFQKAQFEILPINN